ncbi:hypothetical protein LINGRAHAP2_LOCUS16042 [Linum grandiflorum]
MGALERPPNQFPLRTPRHRLPLHQSEEEEGEFRAANRERRRDLARRDRGEDGHSRIQRKSGRIDVRRAEEDFHVLE